MDSRNPDCSPAVRIPLLAHFSETGRVPSMFEIQNYYSFLLSIFVFQLVPGPGTITILNATARSGIRAGIGSVVGTLSGDFVYMTAAVAGIATVMQSNALLYECLQVVGAGYLCWVGIKHLVARTRNDIQPAPNHSAWPHFRRAFAVSLTNPKAVLFFVAFFPLFLRRGSSALTFAMIMLHVTLLSFLYQMALVFVGNTVVWKLRSLPFVRRLATRLAGIALLGFGIRLAATIHSE